MRCGPITGPWRRSSARSMLDDQSGDWGRAEAHPPTGNRRTAGRWRGGPQPRPAPVPAFARCLGWTTTAPMFRSPRTLAIAFASWPRTASVSGTWPSAASAAWAGSFSTRATGPGGSVLPASISAPALAAARPVTGRASTNLSTLSRPGPLCLSMANRSRIAAAWLADSALTASCMPCVFPHVRAGLWSGP